MTMAAAMPRKPDPASGTIKIGPVNRDLPFIGFPRSQRKPVIPGKESMLKRSLVLAFSMLTLCLARQARADDWVPSSASSPGYTVRYVTWDNRTDQSAFGAGAGTCNARIKVVFNEDRTTAYAFYFHTSSVEETSKANSILATLLSAKATVEFVYIALDGTNHFINQVQVGSN
jgi:hypothetical protein